MTLDLDRRATHWPDRPAEVDHTAAETLTYGDLEAYARDRLADYEVPDVDALPRSGPGKLDRDELARRYGG